MRVQKGTGPEPGWVRQALPLSLRSKLLRPRDHTPHHDYISEFPRASSRDHRGHTLSVTPHPTPLLGYLYAAACKTLSLVCMSVTVLAHPFLIPLLLKTAVLIGLSLD